MTQNDLEYYSKNPIGVVLEFQKSKFHSLFSLTDHFRVNTFLKQVHQMTPKWHWPKQSQMYPHLYVTVALLRQISIQFSSVPHHSKMTLNSTVKSNFYPL